MNKTLDLNIADTSLTEELANRYLTFYIENSTYALELTHVIEIIGMLPATKIPGLPPYFKGIVNLRGKVIPIIDVRLKFEKEERPYDELTCIIIVSINEMGAGLIVDSVAEVLQLGKESFAPPPANGINNTNNYLKAVTQLGERVILAIDCQKFFDADLSNFEAINN